MSKQITKLKKTWFYLLFIQSLTNNFLNTSGIDVSLEIKLIKHKWTPLNFSLEDNNSMKGSNM